MGEQAEKDIEFIRRHIEVTEIFKKYGMISVVDWLETLDNRISNLEKKIK